MLGNNVAHSTDFELTGWPYQVDVVRENLGCFTSQLGLSASLPMISNYMADLHQGVSKQISSIFLAKLFPMNFTQWVCYKKPVSLIQPNENTNPVELNQVRWIPPNSLNQKEKIL